jgi:hypothetical protein
MALRWAAVDGFGSLRARAGRSPSWRHLRHLRQGGADTNYTPTIHFAWWESMVKGGKNRRLKRVFVLQTVGLPSKKPLVEHGRWWSPRILGVLAAGELGYPSG